MSISIRPSARLSVASKFIDDILLKKDIYHLFFGKIEPWSAGSDTPGSVVGVSDAEDRKIRGAASYFRRVLPGEASLVTARYDWKENTVYAAWDDTLDMTGEKYYVVTQEYKVYKCIDNNLGTASVIEPTGSSFSFIETADGYVWKYMYTIPVSKRKRFSSLTKIPVQKAFTDSFYNNGAIEKITVNNSGSGYSSSYPVTLTVTPPEGPSVAATAKVLTVDGMGSITSVEVTNPGAGYTSLDYSIAGGLGGVLDPVIVAGSLDSFTIVNGGSGYSVDDPITISVNSAVLAPVITPLVDGGEVIAVKILSAGSGYTANPTVSISVGVANTATGRYPPNTEAKFTAIVLDGAVDRVLINDPGMNYPSDQSTTIAVIGDGTGASLVPVIEGGKIVDVFVANPGVGYSSASLEVTGTGIGAALNAIIADYDITTDQSIVEQAALDGGIHRIVVEAPGSNYTDTTVVTIVGDGTGATAIPILSAGAITKIKITSWGSGYTWAKALITDAASDANRDPPLNVPKAEARVVISPAGGHGKDAPRELLANTAAISAILRDLPDLNTINQDFRQYGMIRNLRELNTFDRIEALTSYEVIEATFSSVDGVGKDLQLYNATAEYRVVYVSGNTVHLLPLGQKAISPVGILRSTDKDINWTAECVAVSRIPTIDKYSGDMYFVSSEVPFVIDQQQGIIIRTFLTF